jgi:predicted Zn-dependent protease
LISLVVLASLFPSCKPNDPLVTEAQNSIAAAKTAFAQIDKADNNTVQLKHADPRNAAALHLYAQITRSDSPKWIKTAENNLDAYQTNKTPATTANLKSAVAILDSNTNESKRYLALTASPST